MDDHTRQVRLARLDEHGDVARCMAAFRDFLGDDEPSLQQLTKGVRHALANDLAEFIVVGRPAASYVQLRYIWSAWHLADLCWVEDVFVNEADRGKGLGGAMMDFAIARARNRGCHRLQLDANEANTAGTALYRRLGFTNTNTWWDGGRDLYWSLTL